MQFKIIQSHYLWEIQCLSITPQLINTLLPSHIIFLSSYQVIFGLRSSLNNAKEFRLCVVWFFLTDFHWPYQTSLPVFYRPLSVCLLALLCTLGHIPPSASLWSCLSSGMQVTYSPTSLKFLLSRCITVSFSKQIIDYNSKPSPSNLSPQFILLHNKYWHLVFYPFTSLFMVSLPPGAPWRQKTLNLFVSAFLAPRIVSGS